MSKSIALENGFDVPASVADTWTLLNDPVKVLPCMPGAELVEVLPDDNWLARMHVDIGPIALTFDVDVRRAETDLDARSTRLICDARESRGRGGAVATVRSTVASGADGGSHVALFTELEFDGAVAEVAVGPIVTDISRQLTRQFAQSLASMVAAGPGVTAAPLPPARIGGVRLGLSALGRVALAAVRRAWRAVVRA